MKKPSAVISNRRPASGPAVQIIAPRASGAVLVLATAAAAEEDNAAVFAGGAETALARGDRKDGIIGAVIRI